MSIFILRHDIIPAKGLANVEILQVLLGRLLADLQCFQEAVRMRLEDIDPAPRDPLDKPKFLRAHKD